MAEILAKEKQFIKLNQELDRMAITACSADESVPFQADNRFSTYQKSKGTSTLLRKQGAGDGLVEINNVATIKEQKAKGKCGNKMVGGETYRTTNRSPRITYPHGRSQPTEQCPKKTICSDSKRFQTYNRVSNYCVAPSNNSTFDVKYRNPKFLESPSLEVLVKEEMSAVQSQAETLRSGSTNSTQTEDNISTGRYSRTSNQAVASKRNVSTEGLIKFLKSKIIILEEDHENIYQEMAKQKELLDKALEHTNSLEQQRDQSRAKNVSLTEQLARSEKQLVEANKHLKERSLEQSAQNKELETAKRELKLLTQVKNNLEKRLFRANEELESVRNTIGVMKTNEREQKETARKECENKDSQIKDLKQQRGNLLNAYKKQLFLIDNLKRQNILLEQAKMLDFAEKEFAKVLDWDLKPR